MVHPSDETSPAGRSAVALTRSSSGTPSFIVKRFATPVTKRCNIDTRARPAAAPGDVAGSTRRCHLPRRLAHKWHLCDLPWSSSSSTGRDVAVEVPPRASSSGGVNGHHRFERAASIYTGRDEGGVGPASTQLLSSDGVCRWIRHRACWGDHLSCPVEPVPTCTCRTQVCISFARLVSAPRIDCVGWP